MAKFSFQNFLYYILSLLPLIFLKRIVVLGENIFPLFMVSIEAVLLCKQILNSRKKKSVTGMLSLDKGICLFLVLYALWKMVSFSVGLFSSGLMDMEFYTILLAAAGIYLLADFSIEENPYWQKTMVIVGSMGSFLIFISCIKGVEISSWINVLKAGNDGIVSYLLLVTLLSVTNWLFIKEDTKQNIVWLFAAVFQMFVLLLCQSHMSNWVMIFCLMGVVSFFRPRASMIRKAGILLFLFLFLWSNMSLILNYTEWFEIEAKYTLETSVYMELVLALGGSLFLHFWDRLPKGVELQKISMVRMQHYFRMIFGILMFCFLIFVAGGSTWQALEERGLEGFIKALALPLNAEITSGSSSVFEWIAEMGVIPVFLILMVLYQAGTRLFKRCGQDKVRENCYMIFYLVFLLEIFIWEVPGNVLFLFVLLISLGSQKFQDIN